MCLIKIITYLYRLYTGLSYPYAPPKVKIHVIAKDNLKINKDASMTAYQKIKEFYKIMIINFIITTLK